MSSQKNLKQSFYRLKRAKTPHYQRGSLLVGAIIVVAIIGMVVAFFAERQLREMRVTKGERVGNALSVLAEGVEGFINRYSDAIKKVPISGNVELTYKIGNATSTPITISNLNGLSKADIVTLINEMELKGVSETPPLAGAEYKVHIVAKGTCRPTPGPDCKINTLVYLNKVIPDGSDNSKPDYVATHAALKKLGRHGGMSTIDQPGYFVFNPSPNQPACTSTSNHCIGNRTNKAGILAVRGGSYTSNQADNFDSKYLRLNGESVMEGSLNMGKKNIENVNAATLNGPLVVGSRFDSGWVQTGAGTISAKGSIYSQGTIWGKENINSKNNIKAKRWIEGGDIQSWGKLIVSGDTNLMGEVKAEKNIEAKGNIISLETISAKKGEINKLYLGRAPTNWTLQFTDDKYSLIADNEIWSSKKVYGKTLSSGSGYVAMGADIVATPITEDTRCSDFGLHRDSKGYMLSCIITNRSDGGKWKYVGNKPPKH